MPLKKRKITTHSTRKVGWDVLHTTCDSLAEAHPGRFDLVFADPPYNIGQKYADYDDNKSDRAFDQWLNFTAISLQRLLTPTGTLWTMMNDRWAAEYCCHLKRVGLHLQTWVVWYYTFGVIQKRNFTPSHTHLFRFTNHPKQFTFNYNHPSLRIPSQRQLIYNDKRANSQGRLPDNTWILNPRDCPELSDLRADTWSVSRVCGTFHERKAHSPNQLPVALVERCIVACSDRDDTVCDPFVGTGTTGVAAVRHGRHFIGCDVSRTCVVESRKRIQAEFNHGVCDVQTLVPQ